ncbi:hypothetical protein TRFO_20714 [Tritrichomonas foetus]|uniref:Cilia- and flagella-associated protein 69 ARM repeats domain-containing protein n=1 Tax=Tritrichomonas foetus TaxID=1144522 RepID=A0A1J4KFU7_9EUKA|nr:hypothetical protein TRFO_20714 [Tritrichomonas foetus]|eukprot:OHT10091.1 hypothetical protein TRFO_20714 [Tritrichomonas foetus]
MRKKSKQPIPGFAFCNPNQCNEKTTYMREHGTKIQELFSRDETEDCDAWQREVLEELISENNDGFFVTDLDQLQKLITNLFHQLQAGKPDFIPYLQQIITLSMVPFRKISNGDDRRCFHHIGGFFESLCPIIKLPHPELQLEASKAILWFAQNCGPLNTNPESTFHSFYPATDQIALYSFIPTQLHVESVIITFIQTLMELIDAISNENCSSDLLSFCFRALFEFVKSGQSKYIKPEFVNYVLNLIVNYSEVKISTSLPNKDPKNILCTTRVFAHSLLFLNSFTQESPEAMKICSTQAFLQTMWSLFVELLFSSFKNVQKQLRNEILGIIILILKTTDVSNIEKNLINKMFDLVQSVSLLQPDVARTIAYSTKTRNLRLTHEPVDIEIIFLAQDLALVLHMKTPLNVAKQDFISHQVKVLNGPLGKYLEEHKHQIIIHSLQLLKSFIMDEEMIKFFQDIQGPETIMSLIANPAEDDVLFYTLLLMLHLHVIFRDASVVDALLDLPRSNEQILSLILSLLAALMQDCPVTVDAFMNRKGLEILKRCFTCNSAEVVIAAIDCTRSIAPYQLTQTDQRLVFMLLDCADSSPTLLRYAYVGLFLDLLQYQPFIDAALLWKSLKTNSNIQRAIVKWWREEEERLDIRYDKCIIIDIDHPLDGHPLVGHSLRKITVDKEWLLDKNSLNPPKNAYKLDFRARLFLLLNNFPQLNECDCKPTDRIKELMIRSYEELKKGAVWSELKEQLSKEEVKPLHDDKLRIANKLEKMRERSLHIQEQQCDIWQKCENDRIALEQRTYNQLSDGLKTAQYVAENYKQIVNSQPIQVARPYQGRTVKGEDVLVRSGNLRNQQKQDVARSLDDETTEDTLEKEKEMEESYINDCLQDESISYLVQLMKSTQNI